MAVDLATLGLEIQSQSVTKASENLKEFKKDAKEAEAAAVSAGEKGSAGLNKLDAATQKSTGVRIQYAKASGGVWEWNDRIKTKSEELIEVQKRATVADAARAAALAREAQAARLAQAALQQKRLAEMQAGLGTVVDAGLSGAGLGGIGAGAAAATGGVAALGVVAGVLASELISWGIQAVITANKTKTLQEATDEHAQAVEALGKRYLISGEAAENFGKRSDIALQGAERRARAILETALKIEQTKILSSTSDFDLGMLFPEWMRSSDVTSVFAPFKDAIDELRQGIRDGNPDYDRFQKRIQEIADQDPGKLRQWEDQLLRITDAAAQAADQIERMGSAAKGDRLVGPASMDAAQDQFDQQLNLAKRFGIPGVSRTGLSDEQRKAFRDAERDARRSRDAYRDLIKTANDRLDQMRLEGETAGMVGIKAEALRFKLDLLNDALDKGRTIGPEQRAEIERLGEEYERLAESVARANLQSELLFEQQQLLRSESDQNIAATLRAAGLEVDFDSYEAGLIRTNERIREARELATGFIQDFAGGLEQGENAWDAFANAGVNALSRIADKLIQMATDQLIAGLLGSIFGGGLGGGGTNGFGETVANGISGIFDTGFDRGGYTGGRRGRPAGIVHGEEFVVNPDATRRNRPMLEAMNSNQPLPAGGGGGINHSPTYLIDARGAQAGVAEQIANALEAYDKGSVQRLARDFPALRKRTGMV
jgi:hypothetical protein